MVDPERLAQAMGAHWIENYSLSTTSKLKDAWRVICQTFNKIIAGEVDKPWQVIPAPTGAGKTTLVAQYCAKLHSAIHPGVLLVCRTKLQADEAEYAINEACGAQVAVTAHTDSDSERQERLAAPVLVITHQAYRLAIKEKSMSAPYLTRWEKLYDFRGGKRKLTIIDEHLDIFDEVSLQCRDFRLLVETLRRALPDDVTPSIDILARMLDHLSEHGSYQPIDVHGEPKEVDIDHLQETFLKPLGKAISKTPSRKFERAGLNVEHGVHERRNCIEQMKAIERLLQISSRACGAQNDRKLVATETLLDHTDTHLAILDATANLNPVYELLANQVNLVTLPKGLRTYSGCTLHVSKNHSVGKRSMIERGEKTVEILIPELERRLGKERKVLLITHKATAHIARRFKTQWESFSVAHWGALDGKNDWSHYDAIVVCGLPYLDEGLIQSRINCLKEYTVSYDVNDYQWGWLSSCLVQAVNRVRCRRVTQSDGGCDPVDVFLMLPNSKDAEAIEAAFMASMSGITEVEWSISVAKRKAKRSKITESLLAFCKAADADRYPIDYVREKIGASERGLRDVIQKISDASSKLAADIKAHGVTYEKGVGRGNLSYLVKHKQVEKHAV